MEWMTTINISYEQKVWMTAVDNSNDAVVMIRKIPDDNNVEKNSNFTGQVCVIIFILLMNNY